jgi:hypothetical protein
MKRCSTEIPAHLARCIALAVALAASAGAGEWRGTATPGLTLHAPSKQFRDEDLTSWFDQWELLTQKSSEVPWFLDLLHSDLGYARDDDTYLFQLERWSPFAYGEHTLLDVDWRGLRVDGEAHRFRTADLRVTPVGTGDTGVSVLPRLGSHYNDDTDPDDLFFVRRYGGGGEIRLRPDAFGFPLAPLTQLSFYGSQEARTGQHQDRYLLAPDEVGHGPENARFRGRTRELDQDVATLGGRLVAEPFGLATSVLDVAWQTFREHAPTTLVADVAAINPDLEPTAEAALRALFFVPDTNRLTGTLRVSRRIGDATLHGGAFASRLAQTGRHTPLEGDAGLNDNHTTTFSAHGAADVPITSWLGIDAYGKASLRRNDMATDTALFADDNRTQIAPFLRRLRDVRGGIELAAEPAPGARVATGFRLRDVDRDLDYPLLVAADGIPQRAIRPEVSLVRDHSRTGTAYLRGHARLLRRLRISAEGGFAWSPAIGMPTELERATYAEARVSHGFRAPVPITVAVFGHWRDASSDDFVLESSFPGRSKSKAYERRAADLGASLTAVPTRTTTLYLSFTEQWDRQNFPYLRSNVPRPNGEAFLRFYLDSELGWESHVRVFAIGGTQQITRNIDVSLGGWLTVADGNFDSGGTTADALEPPNVIDLQQASIEAAVGVQVRPELRIGLAYRFDRYRNGAQLDEPNLDGHDQSLTLSATYDFELAGH